MAFQLLLLKSNLHFFNFSCHVGRHFFLSFLCLLGSRKVTRINSFIYNFISFHFALCFLSFSIQQGFGVFSFLTSDCLCSCLSSFIFDVHQSLDLNFKFLSPFPLLRKCLLLIFLPQCLCLSFSFRSCIGSFFDFSFLFLKSFLLHQFSFIS